MICLKVQKLLLFILCLGFVFTVPCAYAQNNSDVQRFIVILEEPAVYSTDRPQVFTRNREEYNNNLRNALAELHNDIKSQIPTVMTLNSEGESLTEFSYTDVLNGFTITTDAETAEKIKTIDGVKEVFPDEVIAYAEESAMLSEEIQENAGSGFSAANPGNEMNVQYAYEKGFFRMWKNRWRSRRQGPYEN